MKCIVHFCLVGAFVLGAFRFAGCGAGTGPATPANLPVSIEFLDGAANVPADSSYQRNYPQEMDAGTVDADSLYIVSVSSSDLAAPLFKASFNPTTCDISKAVTSTVTNPSGDNKTYLVTPASALSSNANYCVCETGAIYTANNLPVEAQMYCYTTVASGGATAPSISSISPNGKDVNLASTSPSISFTDNMSTSSAQSNTTVSGAVSGAMSCSWSWDGANQIGTCTPATWSVCDTVSVAVGAAVRNASGTALTGGGTQTFTTLYKYDNDFTASGMQGNFNNCWTTYKESSNFGNYETFSSTGLDSAIPTSVYQIGPAAGTEGEYYWHKTINDYAVIATLHVTNFTFSTNISGSGNVYLGLMSSDASSVFAMGLYYDTFQYRCRASIDLTGGGFASTSGTGIGNPCDLGSLGQQDIYLRVIRSGTTFSAYYSTNGTTYTQLGASQTITDIGPSGANYRVFVEPIYAFSVGSTSPFSFSLNNLDFSW